MAQFVDVTAESGAAFEYESNTFKGAGLAVVDLDGDDLPDLVAGNRDGGVALFRNLGELKFARGFESNDAASAIAAADLDNDGDRDLVLAGRDMIILLANAGDATFAEAARFTDLGTPEHVLPVDLDNDGLLDLHVGNYDTADATRTQNRIYMNRGALAFSEGIPAGDGLTWSATSLDVDADGDRDLYIANDTLLVDFGRGATPPTPQWPVDRLLRNDGMGADGIPSFTDIAVAAGVAIPTSSMGGLSADLDEDGDLDLYVPDFGANNFYVDENGAFVERAVELGADVTWRGLPGCDPETAIAFSCLMLSWSAVTIDIEQDGHDEILLTQGAVTPGDQPPMALLARDPESGTFHELAPTLPCSDAHGLAATDLDGDGDADVVVAPKDGALSIFENRREIGRWLAVELAGTASNRDGLGAVVTLQMASGRRRVAPIGAGGIVHSATEPEAVFGLGDDDVELVEVAWPSGQVSSFPTPAVNQRHRLREPAPVRRRAHQ